MPTPRENAIRRNAANLQRRVAVLEAQIREQQQWMELHGSTVQGYVACYGSKDDYFHAGDGGEAIYAADAAVLGALRQRLARLKDAPTR